MMIRFRNVAVAPAVLIVAALLGGLARPAAADLVIVGQQGAFVSNNLYPFSGYQGEYQQVESATAFAGTGPVLITSVAFASAPGAHSTISDDITLSLSTTAATVAAPSTDFAANRGSNFTTVFSGPISVTTLNNGTFDLVIPVTPFLYDPSQGNLLVDVNTLSSSSTGIASFEYAWNSPQVSRVGANSNGAYANPGAGLVAEFTVAPVPEPSTLWLLAFGLGGFAVPGLRRRLAC